MGIGSWTRAALLCGALACALCALGCGEDGSDGDGGDAPATSSVLPPMGADPSVTPPTSDATPTGGAAGNTGGAQPPGTGMDPAGDTPATPGDGTTQPEGTTPPEGTTTTPGPAESSSGCGAADWPPDGTGTLDVEGVTREYIVTLPEGYDPSRPYPVIFVWHGQGGTAERTAGGFFPGQGYLGLQGQANNSVIFATGQGLEALGGSSGWSDPNDFPFVGMLLDHIEASYCVDSARVFSTGASYGGIMSNRIGCNLGDRLRAIAPIMGSGPSSFFGGSQCTGQVAAWITHGRADEVVTFEQGEGSRDHWQMANGCSTESTPIGPEECIEYSGCDDGYPVVWCPTDLGHTPPSYSAEEIWKFFQRF